MAIFVILDKVCGKKSEKKWVLPHAKISCLTGLSVMTQTFIESWTLSLLNPQ